MNLSELLANQPPARRIAGAREKIRQGLAATGSRLVVIDDDPTGAQAIQHVRIFLGWSVNVLRKAIGSKEPVFFISTNSRSLNPEDAERVSLEAGSNLKEAAGQEKANILLASRSDSTLRGHFPYEVDALVSGLGMKPDGVIIVPAFFEGGRYTIDDIHLAEQDGELVPVNRTEFASDPVFGYKNSDLKKWVEEKTNGKVKAGSVRSVSLKMLREGGPEAVMRELLNASNMIPIIANAACYEDLEVLALGIEAAEERGGKFIYRCAASFIKARGGFEDRPLLTYQELAGGGGPGLIVAGSYVEKTTRQLKRLIDSGTARGTELRVSELAEEETRKREIQSAADNLNRMLAAGVTTALYTSREVQPTPERDFTETARVVMQSLCEVVRHIRSKPSYIIAKGGVTSIELARAALDAQEAYAIGQILGGVPVWRLEEGARWTDIPYVVFPGNVGDDNALLKAVEVLEGI